MRLTCIACKQELPVEKFSVKSNSKRGYHSKCKDCHNNYVRNVWYPKNKKKHQKSVSDWKRKNKAKTLSYQYDSTEEEVECILNIDKCEICSSSVRLVVDHDHKTNKVRGRLCHRCNLAIGHLDDDIDRLHSAVVYLSHTALCL